jgi:hypothetical protein
LIYIFFTSNQWFLPGISGSMKRSVSEAKKNAGERKGNFVGFVEKKCRESQNFGLLV